MTEPANPNDVLTRLVEDARSESPPSMDWDTVERALMQRVMQERMMPPRKAASRPAWVWAAAVAAGVAAGAGGFALKNPHREKDQTVATRPLLRTTIDGSKLQPGAVIQSNADPVTVEHPGRATWVLDPRSMAHLESAGDVITVALDTGALNARVVKVPRPESFVVCAERARIAVHGTAFRVERLGSEVRVKVDEGILAVGPVGSPGFEVPAPGSVVLTLDGLRKDEGGERAAVGAERAGSAPGEHESPKGEAPGTSSDEHPQGRSPAGTAAESARSRPPPTASDPGPVAQRAVAAVKACFAAQTVDESDLKISASTTLSLHVLPSGKVVEARFEPPLAPGVQQCVEAALGRVRFPESPKGLSIQRNIDLGR